MTVYNSVLSRVMNGLGWILTPIINFIFKLMNGSPASISPVEEPLLLTPAVDLAKKIRQREVRAVDVMEAFIARVTEVNSILNAVVAERFEAAISEAMEVDRMLDMKEFYSNDLKEKTLLGVPVSVKEAFCVKDMPNTSGLVSRVDQKSTIDAVVVSNLRKAGAIPFVMTNTSELCMWLESSNRVYGQSNNPYNTTRIVGGSSGGEGCIISSGGSVCGIGSDIGGSIRMPAFFNGIFGHKPSKGIVSNEGQYPLGAGDQLNLLTTGPMCRYAKDLIPLLKVFAGQNVDKLLLENPVPLKSVKVFSMESDDGNPFVSRVNSQLVNLQRKVLKHFESAHLCEVKTVKLSHMKHSMEMWSSRMSDPQAPRFSRLMGGDKGAVNSFVEFGKWFLGLSNHTLPAICLGMFEHFDFIVKNHKEKYTSMLSELSDEIENILGSDGVLLYPSHPKLAPYHSQPLLTPFDFSYTGIFNALELPVTQCPLGLSSEGLPLGVQVVSNKYNDRLSLAVAQEIEKQFGGWVSPGQNNAVK